MKDLLLAAFAPLLSSAVFAQSSSTQQAVAPPDCRSSQRSSPPQGYLWKPAGAGTFPAVLFNHGSGADDAQHTAGQTMAEAAAVFGPDLSAPRLCFFLPLP